MLSVLSRTSFLLFLRRIKSDKRVESDDSRHVILRTDQKLDRLDVFDSRDVFDSKKVRKSHHGLDEETGCQGGVAGSS